MLLAHFGHLGAVRGPIIRITSSKQTAPGDITDPLKSTQTSLFAMKLALDVDSEFTE